MESIERVVADLRAWDKPRDGVSDNPFRLACAVDEGAGETEIVDAWPETPLPTELIELWSQARSATLFEDIDYGQWGLRVLSPAASAELTALEQRERPDDYRAGDIVVGEFIGDQELLVLAHGGSEVLVALPLDPRDEWYRAAPSLLSFLDGYLAAAGEKFWE